ncbi:MAG: exodeoxyribonuclease III [Myxococcota bacterium]
MRIYSWNVNGIRAAATRGLPAWLRRCGGEIVCLQEVRARPEDVPQSIRSLRGWSQYYTRPERPGYSGVGLLARREPDWIRTELGEERFDREGRLQIARFGRLVLANGYFPNGSGRDRDNSRIPFKLAWYRALFDRLQRLRRGGYRVLVLGDFNTAHREIDLARPRQNEKTSGFRPEERAELDRWIRAGWIDSFRAFESGPGHYTWWSQRFGVREKNIGWRIDYVLASPAAMKFVTDAFIHPDTPGSDHCPIGVDLDPAIFG